MKKSVPALQIDLRPSRYLGAFILVSHLGGLGFLLLLPLPEWLIICAFIALLLSLLWYRRQHFDAFMVMRWDGFDQWWLTDKSGEVVLAELLPGSYLHSLVLVLRFRVNERVRSLVLLPDSADGNMLRRLRVRLKQA